MPTWPAPTISVGAPSRPRTRAMRCIASSPTRAPPTVIIATAHRCAATDDTEVVPTT
jgi:hypothetical protein